MVTKNQTRSKVKRQAPSKASAQRALQSRQRAIEAGGERLDIVLSPDAAKAYRQIADQRGGLGKKAIIEALLQEEATRLSRR